MSTIEQWQSEYEQWRSKYNLPAANFTTAGATLSREIFSGIVNGVAQFAVALNFDVSRDIVAHAAGHVALSAACIARDASEHGVAQYVIENEIAAILTPNHPWRSGDMPTFSNVATHEAVADAFRKANTGDFGPAGYAAPPFQADPFPQQQLLAYFATMAMPRVSVPTTTTEPVAVSRPPVNSLPPAGTVVDFYGPHDANFYRCLAASGITGIARYLVIDPQNDPRAITAQEVADAHAAGLEIHFFFEMNPTYFQYFTEDNGRRDVRAAAWQLRSLGAPRGTVVYFTVDAPASRIPPESLTPYFNAIEDTLRNEDDGLIVPGLYGYEAHIEYARANYPRISQHLAQTYGTPRGPLDLWQHEQQQMCGVDVDINACTVTGWKGDDMTPERVRQIVADYLANTYGPALESELTDRLAANSASDIGAAVTEAVKAVGSKLTA